MTDTHVTTYEATHTYKDAGFYVDDSTELLTISDSEEETVAVYASEQWQWVSNTKPIIE